MKYKVNLNNLEKVNNFVNCMQSIPYETLLHSGRYVVDAKSIVGIFSLDLSKPIELEVIADETFSNYIHNKIEQFIVTNGEAKEVKRYREELSKMCEGYIDVSSNMDRKVAEMHKGNQIFLNNPLGK